LGVLALLLFVLTAVTSAILGPPRVPVSTKPAPTKPAPTKPSATRSAPSALPRGASTPLPLGGAGQTSAAAPARVGGRPAGVVVGVVLVAMLGLLLALAL